MTNRMKHLAVTGCVSVLVCGCAAGTVPEIRVSTSSTPLAAEKPDNLSMLERGRAQLDAGLDALAIESFRAEIRKNPDSADAYNGLAVAYNRIGRGDLAQRYFETALAKDPGNQRVQANLARLTGDEVKVPVMAVAEPVSIPAPIEMPAPVLALAENVPQPDVIAEMLANVEALDDASPVQLVAFDAPEAPEASAEVLGRQGILSNRKMVAQAETMNAVAPMRKARPDPAPWPVPAAPEPEPAILPASFQSASRQQGARLERVSLGEVRLVTLAPATKPDPVRAPAKRKRVETAEFAAFGERLAQWLPESIANEKFRSDQKFDEGIMLAAIERAEMERKMAALDARLSEFVYAFFDDESHELV